MTRVSKPSPKSRFLKPCEEKQSFDTLLEASKFCNHINGKFNAKQRYYLCPRCGCYHVTSLSPRRLKESLRFMRAFDHNPPKRKT